MRKSMFSFRSFIFFCVFVLESFSTFCFFLPSSSLFYLTWVLLFIAPQKHEHHHLLASSRRIKQKVEKTNFITTLARSSDVNWQHMISLDLNRKKIRKFYRKISIFLKCFCVKHATSSLKFSTELSQDFLCRRIFFPLNF